MDRDRSVGQSREVEASGRHIEDKEHEVDWEGEELVAGKLIGGEDE